ncbi:MAG: PilZ domain-containing protein [Gammaproteobacteria bacterium]|nr:PilZ domain-containing protein [Gammaproteobacteria bacterium]NIR98264.1 PilZ domain-containing protein [Gammaproteobacteria bacterium]NIT63939.1 PilZ domain-containing protein [Gammaproteobacteria bacterium]NIV20937.1 PilZ domain-containing protein [Gammaproteobacteria bacterium]NIX10229.1 PilZ domain-containing protein [Gammaproteobacteria bacterium]
MSEYMEHPPGIPIELQPEEQASGMNGGAVDGGLACQSGAPVEPGSVVRVRIASVRPPFEASAEVAWCRPGSGHYTIGIRFFSTHDLFRARMAEQACHIEQYKRLVQETEGRALSRREAALEWIAKYARDFPRSSGGAVE